MLERISETGTTEPCARLNFNIEIYTGLQHRFQAYIMFMRRASECESEGDSQ